MNAKEVCTHVERRLSGFRPAGSPERLEGGLLNEVWRVPGRRRGESEGAAGAVIVKHAPPHIASQPAVPLDPSRIAFEARALRTLAPGGRLGMLSSKAARPPRPFDFDPEAHTLVMEDLGSPPALGAWLHAAPVLPEARAVGEQLGRFIGRLHACTASPTPASEDLTVGSWQEAAGDRGLPEAFDNRAMQQTRLEVQYRTVGDLCRRGGVEDAERLGRRAEALGEKLMRTGQCLVMGDLWPPSVLLAGKGPSCGRVNASRRTSSLEGRVQEGGAGVRLIDWELCHYGRPAQDVAHLVAHLWMLAHRAPLPDVRQAVQTAQSAFLAAYRTALGGERSRLLTPESLADCALHFGAEILMRTVGPFREGFLYDELAPDSPPVRTAVQFAARHLRRPRGGPGTFAALAE